MKKKTKVLIASSIAVVAIAGILTYVLWPDKNNEASAAPLNTAAVTKGDILVGVSGSGSVSAINSESIRTKEAGEVDKVRVSKGDVVKKGDVLITFVANDLSDKMKEADKSLANLKTELENKQENYKTLAMNNATESELDSARKAIEKAESDIVDQQDTIASIEKDMLPPDPLTAPIDGTITAVNITEGEQAQNGTELLTMTDYVNLSVTVQVDELDIPTIKLDQVSTITLDALEDKEFTGKVIDIAKEGSSSNGVSLFNVTVGLNESEGVLVGMSAEVAITIEEKKDVLTVPVEAVSEMNGKYFVSVPSADSDEGDTGAAGSETMGRQPSAGQSPDSAVPGGQASDGASAGGQATGGEAPSDKFPSGGFPGGEVPSGESLGGGFSGGGRTGGRATGERGNMSAASGQKRVAVEVGIHDESSIEIISGLSEGDEVVIPTVISTGSASTDTGRTGQTGGLGGGMTGGGFTGGVGGGGFTGGGGGMPGGGGGR